MICLGKPQLLWCETFGSEDEMVHLAQTIKSFKCKAKELALYPEGRGVETGMLRAVFSVTSCGRI